MSDKLEIKDLHGNVLYSAKAGSIRELVERACQRGVALDRADLRGADLKGLDATKSPLSLRGADLSGADLTGARLAGAPLQGAVLRGANVERASFEGCFLDRADLSETHGSETAFNGCSLADTDFRHAALLCPDFRDVKRFGRSAAPGADLTEGATLIAGRYEKADLGRGVAEAKRDRMISVAFRQSMKFTSLFVAGSVMMATNDFGLESHAGAELGLSYALPFLLKELASDKIKEGFMTLSTHLETAVRTAGAKSRPVEQWLSRLGKLAAAHVTGDWPSYEHALEVTMAARRERGLVGGYKAVVSGMGKLVVADAEHLAEATEALHKRACGRGLAEDVTIVRLPLQGALNTATPMSVRIGKDGWISALMVDDAGQPKQVVTYDTNGMPRRIASYADGKHTGDVELNTPREQAAAAADRGVGTGLKAIGAMLRALAQTDPVPMASLVRHDPGTHYVQRSGGAVMVYSRATNHLDNPIGPAVVKPDGTKVYFADGNRIGALAEHPHTPAVSAQLLR